MLVLVAATAACEWGGTRADGPSAAASAGASTAPTAPSVAPPSPPADRTTAPAPADPTFRFATTVPTTLVPPFAVAHPDLQVVDALFDSLTAWGPDAEPVPSAAERWERDATGTTWTFVLRDGATFHDGSPVTAEDFLRAWEVAVVEGEAGYLLRDVLGYDALVGGAAEHLAGVEVVDPRTLVVRLAGPSMDFAAVVAHPGLGPVQRAAWDADRAAYEARPVGNGPFAASEEVAPGRFLRTERFDAWRNGDGGAPAALGGVLFQFSDVDTAYLAFRQGRRDLAALPPGALEQARGELPSRDADDGGPGLVIVPIPSTYLLGFDVTHPPYDDVDVRRAVAQAVDRAAVAAALADGILEPADAVVPPAIPGGMPTPCERCTFDPAAAGRAFAAAGITRLPYAYNRGGGHDEVAAVLRRALGRIGVRLETNGGAAPPDFPDYLADVRSGVYGMFRWGWAPDVPVLDEALRPLFHSTSTPRAGGQNVFRLDDPLVDRLLDRARAAPNPILRRALYRQVEDRVLGLQVVVPVVSFRSASVVGPRVRELRYGAMGLVALEDVVLVDAGTSGS